MKSLLAINSTSSLIYQIVSIVCGFIIPRLILSTYGSEVNGLVNSIMQFLGFISFLDMGVSAVTKSALYKPLAEHDSKKISEIVASSRKFYQRLATILLCYVFLLLFIYPVITNHNFGFWYIAFLIFAISINLFAQYYFGLANSLLLNADQKNYISSIVQTVTLILNAFFSIQLMHFGASIQIVKLCTSLIFLLRPLFLYWYVKNYYQVDKKIKYIKEPLEQKWNGLAQHIASVVLEGTDSAILTIFSTLSSVSIYSVYSLVLNGVKQLVMSVTTGFDGLFGKLYAKNEVTRLNNVFGWYEWGVHTSTTFIFGCTAILILPFIQIYTTGIKDADYYQPFFSILLSLASALTCIRMPYINLILIAGHYKQTQGNYIIAVIMNLSISIIAVWKFDLVGVAIGTLAAMIYQTIWMALYNAHNILHWPFKNFCRQLIADVLTILLAVPICLQFSLSASNYGQWILLAIPVALVWIISALVVNFLLYRNRLRGILEWVKRSLRFPK